MGPPGGGRSPITQRLQRHYNIITYTDLDNKSITMIFEQIVKAFIGGFQPEVSNECANLVQSTIKVYNGVANNLRPTPSKSHYTFNLRDISKIFQGVCSANQKATQAKVDIIRLWIHENQRVFGDRMISNEDKEVLLDLIMEECTEIYKLTKE